MPHYRHTQGKSCFEDGSAGGNWVAFGWCQFFISLKMYLCKLGLGFCVGLFQIQVQSFGTVKDLEGCSKHSLRTSAKEKVKSFCRPPRVFSYIQFRITFKVYLASTHLSQNLKPSTIVPALASNLLTHREPMSSEILLFMPCWCSSGRGHTAQFGPWPMVWSNQSGEKRILIFVWGGGLLFLLW